MVDLLLKHGVVVTARGRAVQDVLIRDGRIERVAQDIEGANVEVIDCTGRFILPGVIDSHVHFRTPGAEHKEDWTTATHAAFAGGVTSVFDMPNNDPAITTVDRLNEKRRFIEKGPHVNYDLYMGATLDHSNGQTNIDEFLASDAIALKVYMGSSTGNLLVDAPEALEDIFERCGKANRLVCVHAEDEALIREHTLRYEGQEDPRIHPRIRDEEVAHSAVKRALHWAKKYNTRLHICHLSSRAELEEFEKFRSERITCEVTPHHLFMDASALATQGNFAKMNPPLRSLEDGQALLAGIRSGVVTAVATDHAPHTREEKEQPYSKAPSGIPGLETMLPLLLDAVNRGDLALEDVVRVTSEGPARVFGVTSGVEEGLMANVVIVDMALTQKVRAGGPGARYTKCGWTAFEGRLLQGWPVTTILNGKVAMQAGEIIL